MNGVADSLSKPETEATVSVVEVEFQRDLQGYGIALGVDNLGLALTAHVKGTPGEVKLTTNEVRNFESNKEKCTWF